MSNEMKVTERTKMLNCQAKIMSADANAINDKIKQVCVLLEIFDKSDNDAEKKQLIPKIRTLMDSVSRVSGSIHSMAKEHSELVEKCLGDE